MSKFKASEFAEITKHIEVLLTLVNAETRRLDESQKARDCEDLNAMLNTLKSIYRKMREQLFEIK